MSGNNSDYNDRELEEAQPESPGVLPKPQIEIIVDGNKSTVTGTGGGLNPRTVIGQTADGTVLLLVIDGRQTTSLGASYEDCIRIMQQYGAINAANLDGGSSSVMVHDGKIINSIVTMGEGRSVPTAWLVE